MFEKFRQMSIDSYGLEPSHYYSLPGLSWDAAPKHSDVEVELITDVDMYQMIERGLRGGISMISHRYAKSNLPSQKDYDPNAPYRSLIYLDANSLYPWAMCQPLPLNDFQFTEEEIDVTTVPDDAEFGYILEIDLKYPNDKHVMHNDYPLAPEKMKIDKDMLSPFQRKHFPVTPGEGADKLVPNLLNKTKYVLHYRNLKLYLSLGMELEKVHRVIKFRQTPWLKSYIEFNVEKRKLATLTGDDAAKDLVKLAMNSVCGKTMENVRKRVNIELVTSKKVAKKRIAKPNFKGVKRFHDDLVAIHLAKPKIELNRPIQAGFAILDLSKYHMYNFHYNIWLKKFPESILLFTDTDSLAYAVDNINIYEQMATFIDEFDFSEYPKDHPLYTTANMKAVGKFKDELKGNRMLKFVGLRPKLYSYIYEQDGITIEKNTAKGVKKRVKNTKLKFDDYEQCMKIMQVKKVTMNCIRSDHHKLFTYEIKKIGLSSYDDKRYICDDGVTTRAHGHFANEEAP